GSTAIIPSPIIPSGPLRLAVRIARIVGSTKSSFTAICSSILRSRLTVTSCPRYTSEAPFSRPKPWTSITVKRNTSTFESASLTASSFVGWMTAMINFMGVSRGSLRRQPSGQDVVDRDRGTLLAVDDHGNVLAWLELLSSRVTGRPRTGVDLDLAIDQVD